MATNGQASEKKYLPKVGPYDRVTHSALMVFKISAMKRRTFKIVVYGALLRNGIILTAGNGIAVLDEDLKQVVCDGICEEKDVRPEPTHYQLEGLHMILHWSWNEFVDYLNSNPRSRGPIVQELPQERN